MKNPYSYKSTVLTLIGLLLMSCAVKEPETSFFVLTQSGNTRIRQGRGTSVFVRRIEVAPYLAKTSLVEMKGSNQVTYAPTARWAEPLDQGLSRAVADNLWRSFGIQAYSFLPAAPPPDHNYDITIRLERFEGNDNGDVVLIARWGVLASSSAELFTGRTTEIHRSGWQPGDYAGLARLLSEEVVELSTEIGRAIR